MTQMDISFSILLFYIFLRNVMAFDKKLAILYRFFNLIISEKNPSREKPQWGPKHIFLNFCLILYQNAYHFVKTAEYWFKSCRSIPLVPPKYTLEN